MARPLRIEYDGAVYHITSRGNARKAIYKEDEDRRIFLEVLHRANTRYNWHGNLSHGIRQLNGVYTQPEKKYSEFIMAGIGEEKIWKDVKGQSILGEDEFIERFLNHGPEK